MHEGMPMQRPLPTARPFPVLRFGDWLVHSQADTRGFVAAAGGTRPLSLLCIGEGCRGPRERGASEIPLSTPNVTDYP
jgi:hypothetical protein